MPGSIIDCILVTGFCFGQATLGQVPVQPGPDSAIPSKVLAAESWFNTPGVDNSMSFLTMRATGGYLYLHVSSRRPLAAGVGSAILKIDTFGTLKLRLDMPMPTQDFEVPPTDQVLARYLDHSGFTTTIWDSAGSVRHAFQAGPDALAIGFHGGAPVAFVNSRVIPLDSTVVGHDIPVPPPPRGSSDGPFYSFVPLSATRTMLVDVQDASVIVLHGDSVERIGQLESPEIHDSPPNVADGEVTIWGLAADDGGRLYAGNTRFHLQEGALVEQFDDTGRLLKQYHCTIPIQDPLAPEGMAIIGTSLFIEFGDQTRNLIAKYSLVN